MQDCIIDLRQAWEDQEDLYRLCKAEPIERPTEAFGPNVSYGFAWTLKAYADYPMDLPVKAVIPHGVYLDARKWCTGENECSLKAVLNYPAYRARVWQEETDKVVIHSASPYLYALLLFRERFGTPETGEGTIFFTAHTVQSMRTTAQWGAVADELLVLDERYQPVTVCMHHVDVIKRLHRPFEQRGLRVVSAGHGSDSRFIYRLLHLLHSHRYVASNDLGSSVFYANAAGKPAFLLDELVRHTHDPSVHLIAGRPSSAQVQQTKRHLVELFRSEGETLGPELEATVGYMLGAENLKTPEGLREDLEYVASL